MSLVMGSGVLAQEQSPREMLERHHPGVRLHEPQGRVRTVYGATMTAGDSPRAAAETFMATHGAVFAGGSMDLEFVRAVPSKDGERTVFMYRQTMDGLPVLGSSVRVVTHGREQPRVMYAGARVAIRPGGGLGMPTITPTEAIASASAHPTAELLERWTEPELVAIYDDAPAGDGVAFAAWRVAGSRTQPYDSWSYLVHARTGEVVRHGANVSHFARDISGTSTGKATPADTSSTPEALGPATSTFTTSCPNDAATTPLRDMLIQAIQGEDVLDAGYTGTDGTYSLNVANSQTVDIHASYIGPGWQILDGTSATWGEPFDPVIITTVTAPLSGVNFSFNATPTELGTAALDAHLSIARTAEYLGADTIDLMPSAPFVVNYQDACAAAFAYPVGGPDDAPYPGAIVFGVSSGACANNAYSTIASHEYGHFVATYYLMITPPYLSNDATKTFHEGFGDALAHLTFDTEVIGQDIKGCGLHEREPLVADLKYGFCPVEHPIPDPHTSGMLLSALWLDIRNALGWSGTRTLFRDWIGLAEFPTSTVPCLYEIFGVPTTIYIPQSADEGTLIEILTADSPDSNPANAVHLEEICEVFRLRNIETGVCPESSGRSTYADCDRSGALDILDFLCYQNAFSSGRSYADCDGDRDLTVLDFLCFQRRFEEAPR